MIVYKKSVAILLAALMVFGLGLNVAFGSSDSQDGGEDLLNDLLQQLDEDTTADTTTTEDPVEQHDAPSETVLSQATYTFDNNKVTLTWNATSSVDLVEIYLKSQTQSDYQRVGTSLASNGKFAFEVLKSGIYQVKIVPVDDAANVVGKEVVLTIKVDRQEEAAPAADPADPQPQPQEQVQTPPVVGPTENFMILFLIIAAIIYAIYRVRRTQS